MQKLEYISAGWCNARYGFAGSGIRRQRVHGRGAVAAPGWAPGGGGYSGNVAPARGVGGGGRLSAACGTREVRGAGGRGGFGARRGVRGVPAHGERGGR